MKPRKFPIIACFMALLLVASIIPANAQVTESNINDYSTQVADFIKAKCNGNCRDVLLLGDDYIIPYYRSIFHLEVYQYNDTEIENTVLTDNPYIQKNAPFKLNEMQDIFNTYDDGDYIQKKVLIITPKNMDSDTEKAIDLLKQVIEAKFNDKVYLEESENVHCNDLKWFDENRGKTIVLVGDTENNRVFGCYPYVEPDKNSMYVDVNVWDPDNPALVIKTSNAEVIAFFASIIYNGQYKQIDSPRMSVLDITILGGTVLVITGVVLSVTGVGAPLGAPLMIIGFTLDAVSIGNECIVKNEGGNNWGGCAFDVALTISAPFIGKFIGDLIGPLFSKYGDDVAKRVGENVDNLGKNLDNSKHLTNALEMADDAPEFAKRISDGMDVAKQATGENIDTLIKNLPSNMDDVAKIRFFSSLADFDSGLKNIEWDDIISKGTKSIDDIPLSSGGKYIKGLTEGNPSSKASEIISFENFYQRGMKFLKGETGPNAVRYVDGAFGQVKTPVDHLVEMDGKKIGVSVTRMFSGETQLTKESAKKAIEQVADDMAERLPKAIDKWDKGVIHLIVKEGEEDIVNSAVKEISDVNLKGNKIVISIVESSAEYVWR